MKSVEPGDVLLATGDATLRRYVRTPDELTIELTLWNEESRSITARGVTRLEDDGTWETEALVRLPRLDDEATGKKGYGILDVEDTPTLRFLADDVDPSG